MDTQKVIIEVEGDIKAFNDEIMAKQARIKEEMEKYTLFRRKSKSDIRKLQTQVNIKKKALQILTGTYVSPTRKYRLARKKKLEDQKKRAEELGAQMGNPV